MGQGEDIFNETDIDDNLKSYQDGEKIGQCTVEEVEDEEPKIQEEAYTPPAPEPVAKIPEVRQKQDVKMPFTEKKFANLPARESQHKEAPYPKSKKIEKDPNDQFIDIEDKDPLWLKDKGDHFFGRHDYQSALNAYSKSIKNDKDFLIPRLNRASTFLKMRWFQACVDECDDIQRMVDTLPEAEKVDDRVYYTKIVGRNYLKRGAALAWLSQFDSAIKDIKEAIAFKSLYSEEEREFMQQDIDAIQLRKDSQDVKLQGDILFARNLLNESLEKYFEALELDPMNEYALSNIGVIYLKR